LKFKIDENLPAECAVLLRDAGFGADTVADEHLTGAKDSVIAKKSCEEDRVLITLDLDFANVKAYPPMEHRGIIVIRLKRLDKPTILALMPRIISSLGARTPSGELWIVESDRVRFRTKPQ
jgi:predicted nuclease of predicted toxin-antitoxin system